MPTEDIPTPRDKSFLKTVLLVAGVAFITSALTVWLTTVHVFPREFKPVELNHKEEVALEDKIKHLSFDLRTAAAPAQKDRPAPAEQLKPEKYSEEGASRDVTFTEREINALIANNTDLANRLAIDLSPDLISAKLLMPLDPDMPILGGKTLKLATGVELRYKDGRPVVILKGVSLWGVPLPNAWLGDLKNIDLVHEYGDEGFWKSFAAGVGDIVVGDESITIKLKK